MTWFSLSKKDSSLQSPALEQRSHQPLGIIQQGESDIAHTLNQITVESKANIRALAAESVVEMNKAVSEFVSSKDGNMFVIDGEKTSRESIICTNDQSGNKTCLKMKYNSIELFKQMQRLEYFCSLPNDINATYFECRKIT